MPAGSGIAAKGSIEVVDSSHSRELARAGEASVLARLARLGVAAACAGRNRDGEEPGRSLD
jgi:hypothetical protein